jgi:hypothetical protein
MWNAEVATRNHVDRAGSAAATRDQLKCDNFGVSGLLSHKFIGN